MAVRHGLDKSAKDKHPNRPASSGGRAVCDGLTVEFRSTLTWIPRKVRLIARDPTFSVIAVSSNRLTPRKQNTSALSDRVQGHRLEADNVCSYAGQIGAQPRRVDKVDR